MKKRNSTTITKGENQKTLKEVPEVEPGNVSFQLSNDELSALIQLLVFSKNSFRTMADHALSTGDEESRRMYDARTKISEILLTKLRTLANIGEPYSKSMH